MNDSVDYYTDHSYTITNSIIENWIDYRVRFVKVFPKEYRRALAENAAATRRDAA